MNIGLYMLINVLNKEVKIMSWNLKIGNITIIYTVKDQNIYIKIIVSNLIKNGFIVSFPSYNSTIKL